MILSHCVVKSIPQGDWRKVRIPPVRSSLTFVVVRRTSSKCHKFHLSLSSILFFLIRPTLQVVMVFRVLFLVLVVFVVFLFQISPLLFGCVAGSHTKRRKTTPPPKKKHQKIIRPPKKPIERKKCPRTLFQSRMERQRLFFSFFLTRHHQNESPFCMNPPYTF